MKCDTLLTLFRLQKLRVLGRVKEGGKAPKAVRVSGEGLGAWGSIPAPASAHANAPSSVPPYVPSSVLSPVSAPALDPACASVPAPALISVAVSD